MNLSVDPIIELLDREIELNESLLTLLGTEKSALISMASEMLTAGQKEKKELVAQLRTTGQRRCDAMAELADALGLPHQDLTVSRLMQFVPEKDAGRLADRRLRLLSLIGRIRRKNTESRSLIRHALELFRNSSYMLDRLVAPRFVYSPSGKVPGNRRNGRLLSGVV